MNYIKQGLVYISLLCVMILGITAIASKQVKAATPEFKVHYINVGAGDGALLELINADGKKHYGMIDTGVAGAAGESAAVKYLEERNIDHLDFLMMTHAHADHIGGMMDILNLVEEGNLKIDHIYGAYSFADAINLDAIYDTRVDSTVDSDESDAYNAELVKEVYDKLTALEYDEEHDATDGTPVYQTMQAGDKFALGSQGNQVTFDVFAPATPDKYHYGRAVNLSIRQINKTSIVCKMTYKNNTFLMTGDTQRESVEEMLNQGYNLKADVLKVPHHGLQDVLESEKVGNYTSNHKLLFDTVHAPLAIISNGKTAASRTLLDLENAGSSTFQTRTKGDIVVTSNGSKISIKTGTNSTASSFDATYVSALKGSGLISNIKVTTTGKNTLTPVSYNVGNTYNLYENKTVTLKFSGTVNSITSLSSVQYKLVNYGQNNSTVAYKTGTSVKAYNGFKGRLYVRYVTPLGYTVIKTPGFTVDTKAPTSPKIKGSKSGVKTLKYSSKTKAVKRYKSKLKLSFSASYGTSGKSKVSYKIVPYGKSRSKYSWKTGNSVTYKKKNKKIRVYVRFTDKSGNHTYRKTNVFSIY